MKCSKCGKEIAEDSFFCEFCGTKIKRNKFNISTNCLKNKWLWPIYAAVIFIIVLLCVILNSNKEGERGFDYSYECADTLLDTSDYAPVVEVIDTVNY